MRKRVSTKCQYKGSETTDCRQKAEWKMRCISDPFAAQAFWPPDGKPYVCEEHKLIMLEAGAKYPDGRHWTIDTRLERIRS